MVDTSNMILIEHTVKTVTNDTVNNQKVTEITKIVDNKEILKPKKKKKTIDNMSMWELFWYYLIGRYSKC